MSFLIPQYGTSSLGDLLPDIVVQLRGQPGTLGLPQASRYVVLLVDGLGQDALENHGATAQFLSWMPGGTLTSAAPSTTAAALASFATGLPPGTHGLVGYQFKTPHSGRLMNGVNWRGGPADVRAFQPEPTQFQGVSSAVVAPTRFVGTGMTEATLRGATFVPVEEDEEVQHWAQLCATTAREHALTYCYYPNLDKAGHHYGVGSWQWLDELAFVDDLANELAAALPTNTCLVVTGDHGMINTSPDKQIVVEREPALAGASLIGGEGRFRHIYTDSSTLRDRWSEELGERAWVFTKQEAIDLRLFGAVSARISPRIGDVIVAMREDWVLLTDRYAIEMRLIGVHGSLTPAEMIVPCKAVSNV